MPNVGEQIEKGGRRLTPQQQKFLDNYIHGDMTQTAAARAAGYKSPNVRAVQLLNNPVVKERMEEMRDELQAKYGVTIAKSIRDLQMIRDAALSEGNYSAGNLEHPSLLDRLIHSSLLDSHYKSSNQTEVQIHYDEQLMMLLPLVQ